MISLEGNQMSIKGKSAQKQNLIKRFVSRTLLSHTHAQNK